MWWRSQLFGVSVILVSWRWKKLKLQIMLRTLRISDKDNYYGVTRWRLLDSTWPNLCERCILDFSADVTGIVSANWSISGGLYRWCGNKDCPLSFSTYSVTVWHCTSMSYLSDCSVTNVSLSSTNSTGIFAGNGSTGGVEEILRAVARHEAEGAIASSDVAHWKPVATVSFDWTTYRFLAKGWL